MLIKDFSKKALAILVIISFIVLNNSIFVMAETITNNTTKNQSLSTISTPTDVTTQVYSTGEKDELRVEIDYLIDNISGLTDDDITNRLNTILDKLELKTSDERTAYTQRLSKAFFTCFGKIGSYKATLGDYIFPYNLWDKMTLMNTLIDGYKTRVEALGYTAILNVLDNDCKVITVDFGNSDLMTYSLNADLMSLKTSIIKGFGIRFKINNDYVLITAKNIESIVNTYIKDDYSIAYVFEFVHLLNYQLAGKASDTSTHIYDKYFEINTFGYHFAAKSYFLVNDPNDYHNKIKKEISSYAEPIYFYIDYSKYADKINKSRFFSFDFGQYIKDGSITFDNMYKASKTSEAYIATKSTGYHALGTFTKTFDDIKIHWAKESIEVLASRLLVNGKSFQRFEPDSKITRAEYAVLLTRILNIQPLTYNNVYKDVADNNWFANNIQAATDYGLINGNKGYFRPNDYISREEMTTILMRAYKQVYQESSAGITDKFEDSQKISSWALESVGGAVEKGFILGATQTIFKPDANATRAEAVTILLRFINYLETVN